MSMVIVCILCTVAALLFWAVCIDSARRERVQRHSCEQWLETEREEAAMDELDDLGRREVEIQKQIADQQRDITASERQLGLQRGTMTLLRAELYRLERVRERLERPDVWPE